MCNKRPANASLQVLKMSTDNYTHIYHCYLFNTCIVCAVYLDNLPKCGQVFLNRQLFLEMCHETIPYFRILNSTDQYFYLPKVLWSGVMVEEEEEEV